MLLDDLKDFTWYNEPENVRFWDNKMEISARPQSEFWQHGSEQHQDSGHFFYSRQKTNFSLDIKWRAENMPSFAQCGIMLRKDEKNWFKAAVVNTPQGRKIGISLTLNGFSDWAEICLDKVSEYYEFSLRRKGEDYLAVFKTTDGKTLSLRMFHFPGQEVKAGAYLCSPGSQEFNALLEDMNFL